MGVFSNLNLNIMEAFQSNSEEQKIDHFS